MIAAAVAAMTVGAFADCGEGGVQTSGAQVYKFTFSGKTTKGVKPGNAASLDCGEGGGALCSARVPAKLKIKGWVVYCLPTCSETLAQGTESANYYAFWALKPYKADVQEAEISDAFVQVIGKKPNKAEMFGKFKGTMPYNADATAAWVFDGISFAGLGKYKASKGIYSSISGNFAGSVGTSWYVSKAECAPSRIYDCATLLLQCDDDYNTVAFGKWSVKYNKSASKKASKTPRKLPKMPSYATLQGTDAGAAEEGGEG